MNTRRSLLAALAAVVAIVPAGLSSSGRLGLPQFRVSVDAVQVDVLVTDGGRPVTGLSVADFELRDAGVVQQIDALAMEDVPLSVMLSLDTSDSVEGRPLAHLKEAARAVVGLLRPADRAALITFSDSVRLQMDWTGDHAALEAAIQRTTSQGSTALHDATYAALSLRDTRPGRTLVLVFSDGADTSGWLPGATVLDIARRNDAVVYAVTLTSRDGRVHGYRLDFHSGIQAPVDLREFPNVRMSTGNLALSESFLDALTDETGGQVVNATRSELLRETFVQVVTEFRSRYLLTYSPRGVEKGGWHPVEVRLKGRAGKVTARKGYLR